MSPQETVCALLAVIAGEKPLSAARELLADDVALLMDDKPIARGHAAWLRWVSFLQRQAAKKMRDIKICTDSIEVNGEDVLVTARWQATATLSGDTQLSTPAQVEYRVRDGKIIRIKTHRRNYVFIHGNAMASSRLAFYALLLRVMCSPLPAQAQAQTPSKSA